MRSARSAGWALASHAPKPRPHTSMKARKTHAAGQCQVPAGTNRSAAIAASQTKVWNSHFPIIQRPSLWGTANDRTALRQTNGVAKTFALDELVDPRSLARRQRRGSQLLRGAGVGIVVVAAGVRRRNGRNDSDGLGVVVEIVEGQRRLL